MPRESSGCRILLHSDDETNRECLFTSFGQIRDTLGIRNIRDENSRVVKGVMVFVKYSEYWYNPKRSLPARRQQEVS